MALYFPLVVLMEGLRCFDTNYDVSTVRVMGGNALVAFIYITGTGLHIAWEK